MSKNDYGAYGGAITGSGIELPAAPPVELIPLECGYFPAVLGWHYPNVYSPFWRLYHNGKAGATVTSENGVVELTPDVLVLTPPLVWIDCDGPDGIPHFWIHFSAEPVWSGPAGPLPVALSSASRQLLSWAVEHYQESEATSLRAVNACLLQLLWGTVPELNRRQDPQLERVLQYLHLHLAEPLPNRVLAQVAGRSVEGFIRWFRRETGSTPRDFLIRRRVREAARLLRYSTESLEAIAEAVGFPNRHYFTRVFSQQNGVSPAKFRREAQR